MGVSRILVVDDEPAILELVRLTLDLEGLEVAAVGDGPAALDHLRRHPVDVVLLDRVMPGMDGLEVLAAIRSDRDLAATPVILVTGLVGTAQAVQGLDRGADDYITKPFVPGELAARVRAQLRSRRHGDHHARSSGADALRRDEEERIARLVADGAFCCVFQPIVDLASGVVVGHEALTRFDTGVDPAALFAAAALYGIGADLERATLVAAVEGGRRQPAGAWLALNVTPSLLLDHVGLDAILRRSGRTDLVLEISEMEPVHDYGALLHAIESLSASVQISVDDAGAGFASLAHILALRARYVKLDKSWVAGIEDESAKRALVAGLQSFATETGASLIAEGIETQAQLAAVCRLGVAYGQGFLLGRPAEL